MQIYKYNKKLLVLVLGLVVSQSFAQYSIKKYTINSGGTTSAGGNYQVSASIGQVDAGAKLTGSNYSLTSGFWQENNDLIFKNGFE